MPVAFRTTDAGERTLLDWMMRVTDASLIPEIELLLYVNDIPVEPDSTVGEFWEATFDGYTRRVIERGLWGSIVTDLGRAVTQYPPEQLTYETTGDPQILYGFIVIEPVADLLIGGEQFDVPFEIVSGEPFVLDWRFSLRSEE